MWGGLGGWERGAGVGSGGAQVLRVPRMFFRVHSYCYYYDCAGPYPLRIFPFPVDPIPSFCFLPVLTPLTEYIPFVWICYCFLLRHLIGKLSQKSASAEGRGVLRPGVLRSGQTPVLRSDETPVRLLGEFCINLSGSLTSFFVHVPEFCFFVFEGPQGVSGW